VPQSKNGSARIGHGGIYRLAEDIASLQELVAPLRVHAHDALLEREPDEAST
jgi:hypothetical protein